MGEAKRDVRADEARIAVLDELVQNQIAAGEVIERPASVVKELVENALDAGATSIAVDLEEGGARLVRVTDDGEGMASADLALAFAPHATSKLADASDLAHIASLGFRGEALASIGSVARCRIVTRRAHEEEGHAIENEGGRLSAVTAVGAPRGTSIEVRDLFFNTPARRSFMKRKETELARCLDLLHRLALAHTSVGFVVTHDGKRLFDVEPSMDLRARVRRAFGAELAQSLVEVRATDERATGRLELTGLVAPPRFARGDTSRQMWFANGRPLRDKLLVRCLKEAYRGVLFEGRQPVAFLELSIDPAQVDVNVHPAKAEVRFREERRVFGFALSALREAVARTDMATPGGQMIARALRREPGVPHPGQRGFVDVPFARASRPELDAREPFVVREVPGTPPFIRAPGAGAEPSAHAPSDWTERDPFAGPFLQVARTYLVRELADGFEIVDQHALHERVTYEALLEEARRGRVERQRFLVPELVELAAADVEALDGARDELIAAGIELAAFGPTTIAISGLPARLPLRGLEDLLAHTAGVVRRSGAAPDAETLLGEVLHSAACRASVMAGDRLSEEEIRALLERAAELGHDQTCPHGRPTRVRFTRLDLERAFLRRP